MRLMNVPLTARVNEEFKQKLQTLAALEHVSESEALRRAVDSRYRELITDRLFGVKPVELEQQPA